MEVGLSAGLPRGWSTCYHVILTGGTSPLPAASNAEMLDRYHHFCAAQYQGGDCLGLAADGPVLDRDDRRTLALAIAFGAETTAASTYSATALAKEAGVSEERIRALLEGIPDVIW